jgi:hypothetical protein
MLECMLSCKTNFQFAQEWKQVAKRPPTEESSTGNATQRDGLTVTSQ